MRIPWPELFSVTMPLFWWGEYHRTPSAGRFAFSGQRTFRRTNRSQTNVG